MEKDPRRWVNALRASHNKLVKLVPAVTDEQLSSPSYCHDWSVAQVLSHLGSGAEISLRSLEGVLAHRGPLPREEFQPIWARWDAMSPASKAGEMVVWDRRCVSVFEGLDEETLSGLRVQMFGMEFDAAEWLSLRLNEHALHSWDVEVSFDSAAEVLPSSVELLVDRIHFLAGRVSNPEAAGGRRRIEVRTTGPGRRFTLVIDEALIFDEDGPGPFDGTLLTPAAALLRLVSGRLDPAHTPSTVKAKGSADLGELRKVFPGF